MSASAIATIQRRFEYSLHYVDATLRNVDRHNAESDIIASYLEKIPDDVQRLLGYFSEDNFYSYAKFRLKSITPLYPD